MRVGPVFRRRGLYRPVPSARQGIRLGVQWRGEYRPLAGHGGARGAVGRRAEPLPHPRSAAPAAASRARPGGRGPGGRPARRHGHGADEAHRCPRRLRRRRVRGPGRRREGVRGPRGRQGGPGRRRHRLPAGLGVEADRVHRRRRGRRRRGLAASRRRRPAGIPAEGPVGELPRDGRRPVLAPQRPARPRGRPPGGPRLRPGVHRLPPAVRAPRAVPRELRVHQLRSDGGRRVRGRAGGRAVGEARRGHALQARRR